MKRIVTSALLTLALVLALAGHGAAAISLTYVESTGTSITNTEYSLTQLANYSSGSPETDSGVYCVQIDCANLVAGDEFEFKLYDKAFTGATQREVVRCTLLGTSHAGKIWMTPNLGPLGIGWDMTLVRKSANSRTIGWTVRRVN